MVQRFAALELSKTPVKKGRSDRVRPDNEFAHVGITRSALNAVDVCKLPSTRSLSKASRKRLEGKHGKR